MRPKPRRPERQDCLQQPQVCLGGWDRPTAPPRRRKHRNLREECAAWTPLYRDSNAGCIVWSPTLPRYTLGALAARFVHRRCRGLRIRCPLSRNCCSVLRTIWRRIGPLFCQPRDRSNVLARSCIGRTFFGRCRPRRHSHILRWRCFRGFLGRGGSVDDYGCRSGTVSFRFWSADESLEDLRGIQAFGPISVSVYSSRFSSRSLDKRWTWYRWSCSQGSGTVSSEIGRAHV